LSSSAAYLVAGVEDERFGLEARRVETVFEYRSPVPLPGRPEPFSGALTHQGELVALAPLAALLGLKPRLETGRAAVAVLRWEDGLLGLALERTHGLAVPGEGARLARVLGRWEGPYLRQTLEVDGERLHLLDLDAIMADLACRIP
jgi:chemotaxis signal transduction protein